MCLFLIPSTSTTHIHQAASPPCLYFCIFIHFCILYSVFLSSSDIHYCNKMIHLCTGNYLHREGSTQNCLMPLKVPFFVCKIFTIFTDTLRAPQFSPSWARIRTEIGNVALAIITHRPSQQHLFILLMSSVYFIDIKLNIIIAVFCTAM